MNLSPPAAGEFAPYFAGYIARVAHVVSPIDELAAQRDRMLALLGTVTDDRAGYRYAPGKWTIADLVGHITDAERIFAYRMLRIGRGDQTPLPGWDENEYAATAEANARPFRSLAEDWAVARASTIALARGLPEAAWMRQGVSNGQPITTRAILYITLGHAEHHRTVLEERYGVGVPA